MQQPMRLLYTNRAHLPASYAFYGRADDRRGLACCNGAQVKMMQESPVNPSMHMNNDLAGKSYAAAVNYFEKILPDTAKFHIMGAAQDQIVGTLEVGATFLCDDCATIAGNLASEHPHARPTGSVSCRRSCILSCKTLTM